MHMAHCLIYVIAWVRVLKLPVTSVAACVQTMGLVHPSEGALKKKKVGASFRRDSGQELSLIKDLPVRSTFLCLAL